jgi:hypothetical protein
MSEDEFYLDEEVSTLEYALRRWWPLVWIPLKGKRWSLVFRPIHWQRCWGREFPAAWRDYGWHGPVCRWYAFGPFTLNVMSKTPSGPGE